MRPLPLHDRIIFQIHPACRTSRDTPRVRQWNVDNSWNWPVDLAAEIHPRRSSGTETTNRSARCIVPRVAFPRACCRSLPKLRTITRGTDARCPISWAWNLWKCTWISPCFVSNVEMSKDFLFLLFSSRDQKFGRIFVHLRLLLVLALYDHSCVFLATLCIWQSVVTLWTRKISIGMVIS